MADKKAILELLVPKAVLEALTPEAERALPDGFHISGYAPIRGFPFRVGRESRGTVVEGVFVRTERPRTGHEPNNDLYLKDPGPGLHVSRQHFQIERTPQGYLLVDRGSACGVGVGRTRIGAGTSLMSAPLKDGDVIAVGTEETPYRYTFIADLTEPGA